MRRNPFRSLAALLIASGLLGCTPQPPPSDNTSDGGPSLTAPATPTPPPRQTSVEPAPPAMAQTPGIPSVGNLEVFATNPGTPWTGITVSHSGRVFVCYPRWSDDVPFTVAELKNRQAVPYPDAHRNEFHADRPRIGFCSVQSVVTDAEDRLWVLDTGAPKLGPLIDGAAKLVAIDLTTNDIVRTIPLPSDVALPTTYLNDIRVNLRQGRAGTAYITDSGDKGPNGIIVVDLDSGRSWRKLTGHPSVRAESDFTATVEGRPMLVRLSPGKQGRVSVGADGIAISPDGKTLYYRPMTGQHLYGISTAALDDPTLSDDQTAQTIVDYGSRGYASDGLESDAAGRIYLTDYEHNAVHRLTFGPSGPTDITDQIIASDPRLIWPDTLCVAADGYVYVTSSQLNREPRFNEGRDLRVKPFLLMRVKAGATPAW